MIQHFIQVSHNSGFGSLGNVVDLTHRLPMYASDLRGNKYSYTDPLMAHRVLGGGGGGRNGGGGGVHSLPGAERTRGMSREEVAQVMNESM
jgi:hypothetical protein